MTGAAVVAVFNKFEIRLSSRIGLLGWWCFFALSSVTSPTLGEILF